MLDKKNSKQDLDKFQDLEGLTLSKMNLGLWFVANRKYFILGFILLMIGASAGLYGYSTFNFFKYYFKERADAAKALKEGNLTSVNDPSRKTVQDLKQFTPQAFGAGEKLDLMTKVNNPNPNFSAAFNICFIDGQTKLACNDVIILPEETKYILSLGNAISTRPSQLKTEIKNLAWNRIDAHKYTNWKKFATERLDFTTADISFKTPSTSGVSDKLELNYLEFNITNNTAYNYWEVPLNIIFSSGTQIVGVNRHIAANFMAGEKRAVRIIWPGNIGSDAKVLVVPDINLLDDNVFMKYR